MKRIALAILTVLLYASSAIAYNITFNDRPLEPGTGPHLHGWHDYGTFWDADPGDSRFEFMNGNLVTFNGPLKITNDSGTPETLSIAVTYQLKANFYRSSFNPSDQPIDPNYQSIETWDALVDYAITDNGETYRYEIHNDDPWSQKTIEQTVTIYTTVETDTVFDFGISSDPFMDVTGLTVNDPSVDTFMPYYIFGSMDLTEIRVVPEPRALSFLAACLLALFLFKGRRRMHTPWFGGN